MTRQFFTADDVFQLSRQQKSAVLILGLEDVITLEAEELADKIGLRVVRETEKQAPPTVGVQMDSHLPGSRQLPPLKVVRGSQVKLEEFGLNESGQGANVRLKDVISSLDGSPIAAGYMTLDKGNFPWTLSYDEIDIILEGELIITRVNEVVQGGAGDVIFIPKGSSIVFSTPNKARFVYVTYPADWKEK
jgi:ethanolamine utilization protein EutQ